MTLFRIPNWWSGKCQLHGYRYTYPNYKSYQVTPLLEPTHDVPWDEAQPSDHRPQALSALAASVLCTLPQPRWRLPAPSLGHHVFTRFCFCLEHFLFLSPRLFLFTRRHSAWRVTSPWQAFFAPPSSQIGCSPLGSAPVIKGTLLIYFIEIGVCASGFCILSISHVLSTC